MQAIITRYHGPTNTRDSRIVAHCEAGRVTLGYSHELNLDGNHRAAALELARRLGWEGEWIGAPSHNATVWVGFDAARYDGNRRFYIEKSKQ